MKNFQHLAVMAVLTIVTGMIYASVQQSYRSNANDPQIQIARDIAGKIKDGLSFEKIFPGDSVDISESLGVFALLYDSVGRPLRYSGFLDNKPAQLPSGVFEYARIHREDWITWQPRQGIRMAMVVVRTNRSPFCYVAVGRSLKEVEIRVQKLSEMVLICWLLCMLIIGILAAFQFRTGHKKTI
jgi:hypothetical protein